MMNLVPVLNKQNRRYDPLDAMSRFFSRWMPTSSHEKEDDFFAPLFRDFPFEWSGMPTVDVEETEKEVIVRAEIPGMEKEEFSIELEGDTLILRGEKKQKEEHKDRNFHRVECSYGRFDRHIALPVEVQSDKVTAEYKNGVLNVTLPKSESAKRKAITVAIK